MKYIIKGTGGQGVLFLAKTISQALLLGGIEDFSFLKEFDEGQRSGEIIATFNLSFAGPDKTVVIKDNNIIELRTIAKDLNLSENNIKQALSLIKPDSFEKNWQLYQGL
jgi:hypothetical protein